MKTLKAHRSILRQCLPTSRAAVVKIAFGTACLSGSVLADVFTLEASDAIGSTSFTNPLMGAGAAGWTDGIATDTAPTGGNDYFTNNFLLRSPTTNDETLAFEGDSLTIDGASGRFIIKSTGSTYEATYRLDGGQLDIGNAGGSIGTVEGTIELLSSSRLGADGEQTLVVDADISGSGDFQKINNGTVILNGTNTHSGTTTLSGGFLELGSASALGSTTAISFNAGVLQYSAANSTDYSALIDAGTHTADVKIVTNGQDVTFATAMDNGTVGFDKRGNGTLTLSAANTYSGTTIIRDGELRAVSGALGSGAVDIGGGTEDGRLELSGGVTLSNNITVRQRLTGNDAVHIQNVSGNNELSGTITGEIGGQHIRIESAAGLLTLSGTITSNPAARDFYLQGAGDGVVSGVINNGGGNLDIFKGGAGTWTLSGVNTYSGNTTVSDGTLVLADDAQLKFVIGANGVNNQIAGTGAVSIGGDFNLDLTGAELVDGNSWTLVDAGTLSENFLSTFTVTDGVTTFTEAANVHTLVDGDNTWTFDESTGVLSLAVVGGYATWADTNAPGQTEEEDFDNDGVSNGIEYVVGGLASTNDLDKLPEISTADGNMVFTFDRDQDSKTSDVDVTIEVGTTLASWPAIYVVGDDTDSSTAGVTVTDNLDGTETIELTVAQSPDAKKFARLVVTVD